MTAEKIKKREPIIGWYRNHANPIAIENKGMQTKIAPKSTTNPAVPFKKPPTKGIYPNTPTIGRKNAQIPNTINTKKHNLRK